MNRFCNLIPKEKYNQILENIYITVRRNSIKFCTVYPDVIAWNGIYGYLDKFYDFWHGGWWTDIFYMVYEYSGDKKLLYYAETLTSNFYELIRTRRILHNEMGFIYHPICASNLRLGNLGLSKEIILLASDYMIELSNKILTNATYKASFLINSILSLDAYAISGARHYKNAVSFIESNIRKYNITSNYECFMDSLKRKRSGKQAYRSIQAECEKIGFYDIQKSRATAYIMLGYSVLFFRSQNKHYEGILYNVLNHFSEIVNVNDNLSPKVETTSLSIICCALFEILKNINPSYEHHDFYYTKLKEILNYLVDFYFANYNPNSQGLISGDMNIRSYELIKNLVPDCSVCGDYFFLQALMHMQDEYVSCWNVYKLL